jgi:gas vesicle protein
MAKTGKTVATLLIGAAIGAAVGYLLATDKEKRQEDLSKIKDKFKDIKEKMAKKTEDLEHDIYHS